jgi:excisionase family DNA binding protein
MADTHGTYQRASVLDAARLLGVSPTTVRRMVRAGTLEAERVERPQGYTLVVLVPTSSHAAATSSHQVATEARTEQPPAEAMVSLIRATIGAVLGPIVAEQAALRQTVERQADRVAVLERENGELRATLALTAPESPFLASTGLQAPGTARGPFSGSWRLSITAAVAVLALVAVVVLLARSLAGP